MTPKTTSKYFAHLSMLVFCVASLPSASAHSAAQQENFRLELEKQYSVVGRDHWTYDALFVLRQVKLDGVSLVTFYGTKDEAAMTRYEFTVAIARILGKLPSPKNLNAADFSSDSPLVTLADAKDALACLREEFAVEIQNLGRRWPEDFPDARRRVNAPPRIILTPSMRKRLSTAKYITQPKTPDTSAAK